MDSQRQQDAGRLEMPLGGDEIGAAKGVTRRDAIGYGVASLAAAAAACAGGPCLYAFLSKRHSGLKRMEEFLTSEGTTESQVFTNDAPKGQLWALWKARGWAVEARHYTRAGKNIKCKLCPNECLLAPEDRGRCRVRVHKEGKLWTLGYGDPCSFRPDWMEKKPLYHFLPGTWAFSIAVPGCGFRCLNCQNWEISQAKPDQIKDPTRYEVRLSPDRLKGLGRSTIAGLLSRYVREVSIFPESVVYLARRFGCESVAYTYSEPSVWYEYMYDSAKLADAAGLRNVWVTCGYMNRKPLEALCEHMHAANVDLKSFDEKIYRALNSGKLQPILQTLQILKRNNVWFEVTNLVVPTYTDKPDMIARMCDWLVEKLGPDYPLHFSRFHPAHKLSHLLHTPIEVLEKAREIARRAGLHYVYIGNVRNVTDAGTTRCPKCKKVVIGRRGYTIVEKNLEDGKCKHCGEKIAGVWS